MTQRRETGTDDLLRGYPPIPPIPEGKPHSSVVQRQGMLIGQAWRESETARRGKACLAQPGSRYRYLTP